EDTGHGTHEDRADGRDIARGGRDRDEARDDAGRGTERGGLAVTEALGEEPAADGRSRRRRRVDPREASSSVGAVRRTTVEAEPAEPQQRRAEHDERQVVGTDRVLAEALALADDEREHERRDTGVDV